jgi:hypothetical protein
MWQMEHSGCRLCSMTFLCGRWTTVVAVCVPGRPYVADGPQWLPYVSPLLIIYVDVENEKANFTRYKSQYNI